MNCQKALGLPIFKRNAGNSVDDADSRMATRSSSNRTPPKDIINDLTTGLKEFGIEQNQNVNEKHSESRPTQIHPEQEIAKPKPKPPNLKKAKIHTCGFCGKKLHNAEGLKEHSRTHTSEKPYRCDSCDKAFTIKGNLTRHRNIHTGEKPHQCAYCLKRFTFYSGLAAHKKSRLRLQRLAFEGKLSLNEEKLQKCGAQDPAEGDVLESSAIKVNKKQYSCQYCQKSFALKATMIDHTRIHTGEKPFKCETCSLSYTQASTLRTHQLTHTGEKRHKCTHCGKTFGIASTLKIHLITHGMNTKRHTCHFCNKQLTQISNLKKHIRRIHLKEKVPA